MKRLVCLLLGFASFSVLAQTHDALLDYSLVAPPSVDRQKIAQPRVMWLTKPDAPEHCAQVKDHDGFAVWKEGCVYWSLAQSTCTIVTTSSTTHSQVGRLFILCLTTGGPA